jgi:hypothetical protein
VGQSDVALTVENIAPVAGLLTLSQRTAAEGETITAAGSFFDPGFADTHSVFIDWGDGGAPTSDNVRLTDAGSGNWSFSATHTLRDDHPTGTGADEATVTVFIEDDDSGAAASSAVISVNNVGPVLEPLEVDAAGVDEDGTVVVSGTFHDPGLYDSHALTIDWNSAASGRPRRFVEGITTITTHGPNPAGTTIEHLGDGVWNFQAAHRYRDDNPTQSSSDEYLITVEVADDDTVSDSTAIVLTVNNVAPQIDLNSVVVRFPLTDEGRVREPLTLSASFTDLGQLDLHDVAIDWGDGDASDTRSSLSSADFIEFDLSGGGSGSFTALHVYNSPGTFQVRLTVLDDDGGTDEFHLEVIIESADSSAAALSDGLLDLLATDQLL